MGRSSNSVGVHMTDSDVDEILGKTDDFELCDSVFFAIADVVGNKIDAENEPEPCRTVTLVWHSGGLISNGGFHYLFEGDFNGDPGYQITAASYRRIKADQAYEAFQDAFGLFPDNRPPTDIDERLEIIESHPEELDAVNSKFFSFLDDIPRLLAAFIRNHREEIRRILCRTRDPN
jgi:hypothetical protein